MNWQSWGLWGFVSTVMLTSLLSASQGMGLTRMNIPFILGVIVTPDRDRAKIAGFAMHICVGQLFALLYCAAFHQLGEAGWRAGALIGLVHALFVLTAGMQLLPGVHPRMASERQGPGLERPLEPPGFLGLNYGIQTPLSVLIAHALYGAVLGAFYQLN